LQSAGNSGVLYLVPLHLYYQKWSTHNWAKNIKILLAERVVIWLLPSNILKQTKQIALKNQSIAKRKHIIGWNTNRCRIY
jgi:hypothetical protein